MEIQARFPFDKVNYAQDTDGHLVLSFTAPSIDWVTQRPKLCVLPVIDLSGSMQGSKLEYAKRSILKLIEHLTPGDICGLFGFESHLHTLVQPGAVTPEFKETLKSAVGKLHVMGGTNFSEGLLGAIQAVKKLDLPLSFIQRVIMFTDGQPTEGVTDQKAILKMIEPILGNVTVSAFGYGDIGGGTYNGCDQDFLTDLSSKAKGNYAYVKDPDAALAAFGKELGGLLSAYATDIRIDIEPVNGHQVVKVVSDVEAEEEDVTGQVEIKLSDLLAEETRHIVLATKFVKQSQAFPRQATVFNIKVVYSVFDSDGKQESKSTEVKAKVQFVKADEAQKQPNKEVDAIVGLAQMVRAQIDAEEKAKSGDYKTAGVIMDAMALSLHGRGHDGLQLVAHNVSHRLGSKALYTANTGYLRSVQSAGTRAYAVSSMDAQAQVDLAGGGVDFSNSVMDHMVQSFTGPASLGGDPFAASGTAVPPVIMGWAGHASDGLQWTPGVSQTSSELPVEESKPPSKRKIKQGKSKVRW
jgi:Ca-activated chloride channel family protein